MTVPTPDELIAHHRRFLESQQGKEDDVKASKGNDQQQHGQVTSWLWNQLRNRAEAQGETTEMIQTQISLTGNSAAPLIVAALATTELVATDEPAIANTHKLTDLKTVQSGDGKGSIEVAVCSECLLHRSTEWFEQSNKTRGCLGHKQYRRENKKTQSRAAHKRGQRLRDLGALVCH